MSELFEIFFPRPICLRISRGNNLLFFFFFSKTFKQNCIALFYFYLREGATNTSRVCAINGGTSLSKIWWGVKTNLDILGVQGSLTHFLKIKIYKKYLEYKKSKTIRFIYRFIYLFIVFLGGTVNPNEGSGHINSFFVA